MLPPSAKRIYGLHGGGVKLNLRFDTAFVMEFVDMISRIWTRLR